MASNGSSAALTAASAQSNFEQAVALSLHIWPALTLAVQNNWGGEASSDKRDWFAGAVVDLFAPFEKVTNGVAAPKDPAAAAEEPDVEYVEEFILQVMCDEFEVNIDDESGFDVAQQIIKFRNDCAKGKFDELADLQRKWESKKGKKVQVAVGESPDQEVDDDDSDLSDDDDDDEDVNMDEAPQLVQAPKEKPPPEVDEDGFTTVARKR
ncbi:hypothetical protein ACHAQA_003293 [Verticillium albo-atrum]